MSSSGDGEIAAPRRPVRNVRPRDHLGRPLPYGSVGVPPLPTGVSRTHEQTLATAQQLLDAGLSFQAHEVLEDAWKAAPERERALWRGLAQLAVGVTHDARGNGRGAVALLQRGADLVAGCDDACGVDVAALVDWAGGAVADVQAGRAIRAGLRVTAAPST